MQKIRRKTTDQLILRTLALRNLGKPLGKHFDNKLMFDTHKTANS